MKHEHTYVLVIAFVALAGLLFLGLNQPKHIGYVHVANPTVADCILGGHTRTQCESCCQTATGLTPVTQAERNRLLYLDAVIPTIPTVIITLNTEKTTLESKTTRTPDEENRLLFLQAVLPTIPTVQTILTTEQTNLQNKINNWDNCANPCTNIVPTATVQLDHLGTDATFTPDGVEYFSNKNNKCIIGTNLLCPHTYTPPFLIPQLMQSKIKATLAPVTDYKLIRIEVEVEDLSTATNKDPITSGKLCTTSGTTGSGANKLRCTVGCGTNPCTLRIETITGVGTTPKTREIFNINAESVPLADKLPPQISNGQPTGTVAAGTIQAVLSVDTNEPASCRFDINPNLATQSFAMAPSHDRRQHTATLTGLVAGTHTRYVRCTDFVGNKNTQDFTIQFTIPTQAAAPNLVIDDTPVNSIFASPTPIASNTPNFQVGFKIRNIGNAPFDGTLRVEVYRDQETEPAFKSASNSQGTDPPPNMPPLDFTGPTTDSPDDDTLPAGAVTSTIATQQGTFFTTPGTHTIRVKIVDVNPAESSTAQADNEKTSEPITVQAAQTAQSVTFALQNVDPASPGSGSFILKLLPRATVTTMCGSITSTNPECRTTNIVPFGTSDCYKVTGSITPTTPRQLVSIKAYDTNNQFVQASTVACSDFANGCFYCPTVTVFGQTFLLDGNFKVAVVTA